jgi:hypothetical protein
MRVLHISIDVIQPHFRPWVNSKCNKKECPNILWAKSWRRLRLKTSPPSMNIFSRQCRNLNTSQPFGSRGLLQGQLCFLYVYDVRTSQEAHASTVCYGHSFAFLYVDDVRTSQKAHASTVCYGHRFAFLYVDDVRTSKEAHASTVCYGHRFAFLYVYDVRTSQEAHASTVCYEDSFVFLYVDEVHTS